MSGKHYHNEGGFTTDCNPAVNDVTPKHTPSRQRTRAARRAGAKHEVVTRFGINGKKNGLYMGYANITRREARRIAHSMAKQVRA